MTFEVTAGGAGEGQFATAGLLLWPSSSFCLLSPDRLGFWNLRIGTGAAGLGAGAAGASV